jgi:serine/threonine protein kinase
MLNKGKRDSSAEKGARPMSANLTPGATIIDLIKKLNANHARASPVAEPNRQLRPRSSSLPKQEEEMKTKLQMARPPIVKKPSLTGLNATEEVKNKLPPRTPVSSRKESTGSVQGLMKINEFQGTGNIDDYLLGTQIGQGAYAIVRSAVRKSTNTKHAVKTYEKSKLLDPHRKRSVQREIEILSMLKHQNIVKLFEVIDTGRQLHLVLEYVGGCSLHSFLKRRPNRRLEEMEARRIFKQVLLGIEYCHHKSVTHRDIKLENLLLDDNSNIKIIDFGFSTCFSHDKKAKMFCGTPSYMSPEIVARIEYYGPPADVWALGVLLYVLLCGCYPFKAQSDKELYKKIQYGQFTIPSHVSQGARSLIGRIMRVDANKRPSVHDILKDNWVISTEVTKAVEGHAESLPKSCSTGDPLDAEIVFSLVRNMQKRLGYTEEELKVELKNENSHAALLYKHLKKSKGDSTSGSFNKGYISAGMS